MPKAIMGPPEVCACQLDRLLESRNPRAPRLGDYYLEAGALEGPRGDMAFCQMLHETGFLLFAGLVKPWQHNFCGLGATGTPDRYGRHGTTFRTAWDGIVAQAQHLKAYGSTEPCSLPCLDPRFGLVKRGSAMLWTDLDGKWAVPGKGYGARIEQLLEEASALPSEPLPARPAAGPFPAEEHLIPAGLPNRPGTPLKASEVVIHRTGNPQPGADALAHAKFWASGRVEVSCHYVVDAGRIVMCVPETERANHAGSKANSRAIGVEICEHDMARFPEARERAVWLAADICIRHNLDPLRAVTGHYYYSPGSRAQDPVGILDWLPFLADVQATWLALRQERVFSDVPAGHWAEGAIRHLAGLGVLQGRPDGTFGPDEPLSRAEAAVLLDRALAVLGVKPKGEENCA